MHARTQIIARIGLLLGLTLSFQAAGLPQWATGPVVNALLFLAAGLFGSATAAALGCLTPLAGLIGGQLPSVLWPVAPCIAAANVLMVFVFAALRRRNAPSAAMGLTLAAVVFASTLKAAWLWIAVRALIPALIGHALPSPFVEAFVFPQWFTALAGGIAAAMLLPVLSRAKVRK
jgi:hypothetical protein